MGDMSKILSKRLKSMKDEKLDGKDDLFGKLVVVELKVYNRGKSTGQNMKQQSYF